MIENSKIIEAFNFRHACKVFDDTKQITESDFKTILEVGRLSPSSFGFEPWKYLVVQNTQLREKLKVVTWGAQNTLPTASHYVIILARKQSSMHYDSSYITHMMKDVHKLPQDIIQMRQQFYKNFQLNDFDLLESKRATFDWASKQTYIALGNMMSTAAMLGIDSCPIEGFQLKEAQELLSKDFGVDTDEFGISVMVAFGYRVEKQKKKTRQTSDDLVEWFI